MGSIRILDEAVANQIAAGEVVERPAALVKELVENAIDAGASQINIEFSGCGQEFIRVADNGWGMTEEEALMAIQRHATSKIKTAADLTGITTLGFRGEALPSIGAVARMEILTAPREGVGGTWVTVTGGQLGAVEPKGAPPGTIVTVRDLFFNTPARRKYLKRPATEAGHIVETTIRLALSHPQVAFNLRKDSRTLLATTGSGRLQDVILAAFGKDLWEEMIPLEGEEAVVRLQGFIGRPLLNRSNRSHQYFFVNGRFVKSPLLTGALEDSYRGLLPVNRYPVAFLQLQMDPRDIDVNVHPTKLQVKFAREREIRGAVQSQVAVHLRSANLVPGIKGFKGVSTGEGKSPLDVRGGRGAGYGQEKFTLQEIKLPYRVAPPIGETGRGEDSNTWELGNRESSSGNSTFPSLMPLGQVYDTYLIAVGEAGLFLLDQHAAHERVLYERLQNMGVQEDDGLIQTLLTPLTVELPPPQWDILMQNIGTFQDLGFQVEEFGGYQIILHGVPAIIPQGGERTVFLDVVEALAEERTENSLNDLQKSLAVVLACRSAIKGGHLLKREEMVALLEDLALSEAPFTCPHGRPTLIHLPPEELEKRFRRVQ